jgi:hypothetical protein
MSTFSSSPVKVVIVKTLAAHEEIEAKTREGAELIALENAESYDYETMQPEYAVTGEWWYPR